MTGRGGALFALLLPCFVVACEPASDAPDSGPRVEPADAQAGPVCARPTEGCPCSEGSPPIECYLPPRELGDGRRECSAGTRYCRDGAWTACESLHSYVLGGTSASLIDGPNACDDCDPACSVSRDIPGPGDLTPDNSSGVEYQANPGGITLIPDDFISTLPDADADGVPDEYDLYPADPTRDGFTEEGGLFHVIPYGATAGPDGLEFSTALRTADIYFLIDHTGSMGGEIANLRNGLTTGTYRAGCTGGVIGAIQCIIPDAWIGVGEFAEYPVDPYGDSNDVAYSNLLDLTADVVAAQNAVNGITTNSNITHMEALTQALYATATGNGLGPYLPARTGCPAGHWGYPCFRPDTIPIVILITDAPAHNGPNPAYDYNPEHFRTFGNPTRPAASGNDTIATAYNLGDVTGAWVGATGTTQFRTNAYEFGCNSTANDAAFRFTLTAPQRTTITLAGSAYDTSLAVVNASTLVGWCDEDSGPGNTSQLTLNLGAGDWIVLIDGEGQNGSYTLTVGDPCTHPGSTCFQPPTYAQTIDAVRGRSMLVMGIESSEGWLDGRQGLEEIVIATDTVDDMGDPFLFSIEDNGTGLDAAVVDAVEELANYRRMDITARPIDNPATPAVDERGFVAALTAQMYPPGRCDGIGGGGSSFLGCLPGTQVEFAATFQNNIVTQTAVAQVFDFTIEILGDGSFVLDSVPVRIVVPPSQPVYPDTGTYWRDYDSTQHCEDTERPDWRELSWVATTDNGTSIRFEIRTSDDPATLDAATPVTFLVPPATPPRDVAELLTAADQSNYLNYLQVRAVLRANDDNTAAPVLTSFELRYTCIPSE